MRVAGFFFAEQINVDDGLYCRGGFRQIATFDSYPASLMMPLVIVVEEIPTDEPQTLDFDVEVFHQGDVSVSDVQRGTLTLAARHPDSPLGLPSYMFGALLLEFTAPEPGMYRAALRIGGEDAAEYLFHAQMKL
jgi:hypothetical protein